MPDKDIFEKFEKELTRRRVGIVEQQQQISNSSFHLSHRRNPHRERQFRALEMQCDLLNELLVWLDQMKANSEVQSAESR